MKTSSNKIKKSLRTFIAWIVYWIPILLVISVFLVSAMMIGNIIGKQVWIVFAADLVFFYLLWVLFDNVRKHRAATKTKILIWASIALLLFIALTTLGVSIITEKRIILNIFIFPIGCLIVLTSYVTKKSNRMSR